MKQLYFTNYIFVSHFSSKILLYFIFAKLQYIGNAKMNTKYFKRFYLSGKIVLLLIYDPCFIKKMALSQLRNSHEKIMVI